MKKITKFSLLGGAAFMLLCVALAQADQKQPGAAAPDTETHEPETASAAKDDAQSNQERAENISYHKPDIHDPVSDKYIKKAMSYLGDCHKWNDNAACMEEQDKFIRQYVNALAGDYKAQQDVIFDFSLQDGDGGPVVTNQVEACAWSKVVANSKSPYVTQQDRPMMIMRCDGLSPASLDAVSRETVRISSTIATGRVHRLAVPELEYDPRSGKNETEAD